MLFLFQQNVKLREKLDTKRHFKRKYFFEAHDFEIEN